MMSKELLWQSAENISTTLEEQGSSSFVSPQFLWSWNVQVISISLPPISSSHNLCHVSLLLETHKKNLCMLSLVSSTYMRVAAVLWCLKRWHLLDVINGSKNDYPCSAQKKMLRAPLMSIFDMWWRIIPQLCKILHQTQSDPKKLSW